MLFKFGIFSSTFTKCSSVLWRNNQQILCSPSFPKHLFKKTLHASNLLYPISSFLNYFHFQYTVYQSFLIILLLVQENGPKRQHLGTNQESNGKASSQHSLDASKFCVTNSELLIMPWEQELRKEGMTSFQKKKEWLLYIHLFYFWSSKERHVFRIMYYCPLST